MDATERYRQVAALHAQCISGGFLSSVGVRFLALMYRAIDESEGSVLLVEEREGRVVGFISGSTGMGAIYRSMLKHPVTLARALLPALIRPSAWRRVLEIVRYSGRDPLASLALPRAELLSLAVCESSRGMGVADMLYRRLMEHFASDGAAAFRIIVGDALERAHAFYLRMGAREVTSLELHRREVSRVYVQAW